MPKIAFVHNDFPAGGAERVTIDIARYLCGCDGAYEVFVYAHRCCPGDYARYLTLRQIPSQAIQSVRSRAIERLLVSDKIDVLVQVGKSLHGIEGIKRRTGVKAVLACHGEVFWQRYVIMNRRQRRKWLWKLLYRPFFQDGSLAMKMAKERTWKDYCACDAYTVLCEGYRRQMENAFRLPSGQSKLHVIENSERPVGRVNWEKRKVALFCGRLENWSKRIDSLLRIWQKVQHDMPDWTLRIVGGGKDAGMLAGYAEELGLERVDFAGHSDDVPALLDEASVVLLVSQTEGLPLALTEAMARGCICLAFACSDGVRSIFADKRLEEYCIQGRDEDAYAAKLLEIASMKKEDELCLRQACVGNMSRFAPDVVMPKWKNLFDTLVKTNGN